MLEAALAAGIASRRRRRAARRRAADARRAAAARPLRLRPRRRHLRVAQPVRGQRDQVLRRRRLQALRRDGARDRAAPGRRAGRRAPSRIGAISPLHGTDEDYLRALQERFAGLVLAGVDVVLDCANGSTYRGAPEIFRRLGATVTVLADEPDGRNINDGCGSTHIEALVARMRAGGHDVGFAFDGDGDRVLAIDRTGAVVDGDELVALATLHLRAQDRLPGGGVVVTVMTNYGFHTAMRDGRGRGRDDRGRRPLRARGAARARLGPRRRAVRPHHRHGLRALRRRDRLGAADARGARPAATSPSATRWTSCPRSSSTCASPTATRRWRATALARGDRSASRRRSRAAAACSCARRAPSSSCA